MNHCEHDEVFPTADKMEEECGVFGAYSVKDSEVADLTYLGLLALQHRGQESAGISVTTLEGEIETVKGMGLISQIFTNDSLNDMNGHLAIGHVRYSTAGDKTEANAQPLEGHCKLGSLAIAHNGNLVNTGIIRSLLEDGGVLFRTSSDSEVILNLIARGAKLGYEEAVVDAMTAVKGSYAVVISIDNKMIGVRDPYGIRPLCIGKSEDHYFLSSESCAFHAFGGEFVRDVEPGEIVIIDENGFHSIPFEKRNTRSLCVFEYIYFARPDSVMDGISVFTARENFGRQLFEENKINADVVVPVPDSGSPSALGYSRASGISFSLGFIKNHYVGRTFINPSQAMRERAVTVKLTALKEEVAGKKVLLIDDSIVRGTTCRKLIQRMREAGAKEVHFAVTSPPVTHSCYFGIDTPTAEELIANNMDVEGIRKAIGADSLCYLSLEGMRKALGSENDFCTGCLTGVYPIAPYV